VVNIPTDIHTNIPTQAKIGLEWATRTIEQQSRQNIRLVII
jgi:hypothetical protein